jgi:hypothetical protein
MDASVYSHLSPAAQKQVLMSDKERIFAIRQGVWIPYPRAKEILSRMEDLFDYPRIDRMPHMLIIGASNNGKTNILRKFESKHKPDSNPDGDYSIIPVLFVQAPKKPDINNFYDRILEAIWQPYSIRASDSEKEREVIKVLRNVQLKVLMVDELQHINAGGQVKRQEFRNGLKILGNELKLSIVGAGVDGVLNSFTTDEQLANRFEPEFLPKWNMNNEYGDLLESFEFNIPLKTPSNLRDPNVAQKILWLGEGILGEIHEILKRAAIEAIKDKSEQITLKIVEKIRWTAPSKRKSIPT